MFDIGATVRIKPPFNHPFDGEYQIVLVNDNGVRFVEGIEGGFDIIYLEEV